MNQILINFRDEKAVKDEFNAIAKAMGLTFSGLLKMKMRETIREVKSIPGFTFSNDEQLSDKQITDLKKTPSAKKLDKTIYSVFGKK